MRVLITGGPAPGPPMAETAFDQAWATMVRGLMRCAAVGTPGEIYNLPSGAEPSILDLATQLNRLTGNGTSLQFLPKRDWDHSGGRFGSTAKAKREVGFEAQIGIGTQLRRTVEWTGQNLRLIDRCIQKHAASMAASERGIKRERVAGSACALQACPRSTTRDVRQGPMM